MAPKLKKILSALFIVLSVAVVVCIAFSNPELSDAWGALRRLDAGWIAGLFGCWAAYAFFDALGTWICLRKQGFRLSLRYVCSFTLVGFFYSSITPGASGGQAMEVNSMRRAGVPVGNGTSAVTVRLVFNQLMVSVLSLGFWLFNRGFVSRQLGAAVWFVRVGWVINAAVVPLVLLAAFRRSLVRKLAFGLIGLLVKIRLVKNREALQEKVTGVMDTYHNAVYGLLSSPGQILLQCLCSTLSLLGLTGSMVFVYHAFGMSGVPWYHVLTLSLLLFVSASYTPLPGAGGAQEGGFMLYFNGVFTGGTKGLALLVWRFFTYYLFLFVGIIAILAEKVSRPRSHPDRTEVPHDE